MKHIDPDRAYIENCPKGPKLYSKHYFLNVKRTTIKPGIVQELLQCQHCGGRTKSILDYNLLAGVFSIPARKK